MRHLVSCKVNLSVSIETSSQGRPGLLTVIGDVKRGGGGERKGGTQSLNVPRKATFPTFTTSQRA